MNRTLEPVFTDMDRLLAPVSADNPAGESLRYEGTYDLVREARREDDARIPQGVWQSELKHADWQAVESLCARALAGRSKDLQLAAWLLEAWIQLDGFAGAARGVQLIHGLCQTFWQEMYPPLEEDLTSRLAPVHWINEKLARRLRLLPLTQPMITGVPEYSLADWDAAMRNPAGSNNGEAPTLAKIEQSASVTPYDWFANLHEDAVAAIEAVRSLDELLDKLAGSQSPGLIRFRSEAETAAQLIATMLDSARARLPVPESAPEENTALAISSDSLAAPSASAEEAPAGTGAELAPVPGARIRSRAEAYRLLEEVADYLSRADPHSPTPYLIRRAVTWGGMHFNELLPELVRNQGELSDIVKLLGLEVSPNAK